MLEASLSRTHGRVLVLLAVLNVEELPDRDGIGGGWNELGGREGDRSEA